MWFVLVFCWAFVNVTHKSITQSLARSVATPLSLLIQSNSISVEWNLSILNNIVKAAQEYYRSNILSLCLTVPVSLPPLFLPV